VDLSKRCSTGAAIFVGGWALMQLRLFWIAPIAGAAVAGIVHRQVFSVPDEK
jgi:aquaporin Z